MPKLVHQICIYKFHKHSSICPTTFFLEIPFEYQPQNQNYGQQSSGQPAQGGPQRSLLFQQIHAQPSLNVFGSQQSNHLSGQNYSTQQPIPSFPNLGISRHNTSRHPEPQYYAGTQENFVQTPINIGSGQQLLGQQPTSIANSCSHIQTGLYKCIYIYIYLYLFIYLYEFTK